MAPKPVFICKIHFKFAKNQYQNHTNPLGRSKNTEMQKKIQLWKKWKKNWLINFKSETSNYSSNINFPRFPRMYSFSLYNQFCWGNSGTRFLKSNLGHGIWPLFWWMLKLAIEHDLWTQKECLKVLIPMFWWD